MGAGVLPSLLSLSLLLVIAVAGPAGAEDAMIRPAAPPEEAGNNTLGETLCCSNNTGFHECVKACFILLPDVAEKYCDKGCKEAYQCKTVSGDKCPISGHRSSTSAEGNAAVDQCILGCNSNVCNKMVNGDGRKGVMKHAVESCNNACYEFCTKGVRATTYAA